MVIITPVTEQRTSYITNLALSGRRRRVSRRGRATNQPQAAVKRHGAGATAAPLADDSRTTRREEVLQRDVRVTTAPMVEESRTTRRDEILQRDVVVNEEQMQHSILNEI